MHKNYCQTCENLEVIMRLLFFIIKCKFNNVYIILRLLSIKNMTSIFQTLQNVSKAKVTKQKMKHNRSDRKS